MIWIIILILWAVAGLAYFYRNFSESISNKQFLFALFMGGPLVWLVLFFAAIWDFGLKRPHNWLWEKLK